MFVYGRERPLGDGDGGDVDLAYLRMARGTQSRCSWSSGGGCVYAHMRAGFDRLADVCELVYYDRRGQRGDRPGPRSDTRRFPTWTRMARGRSGRPILVGHLCGVHGGPRAAARPVTSVASCRRSGPIPLVPEVDGAVRGRRSRSRRPRCRRRGDEGSRRPRVRGTQTEGTSSESAGPIRPSSVIAQGNADFALRRSPQPTSSRPGAADHE